MPGPGFTTLFGGNTVYPAQPSLLSLNPLTASVVLQWPFEQQSTTPSVAEIVEVNATAPALTIQLSDARQISTGYCTLFNNIGANTFTVLDATGAIVIAAIPSGTVWELYLADNSTQGGTWRTFQFGAGVSTPNAAALAGAGLLAITTTLNQNYVTNSQNANYVSTIADRAQVIEWTGGTGTITLPVAATVGAGWFCAVKNLGTGNVTVSPPAGTIDSLASLIFAQDNSSFIICDGVNYYSLGFGQTVNSIFDFIQISLAGASGNVVLAGAQLNRVSYRFIGALAGNVNIVVPATIQQYWVDNETSGAFTLTVTTGVGTTTAVAQGTRNILYSDGVNIVPAVTFGSTGFVDGTAAAPSIFFASSPATGFYKPAANQVALATAGTQRILVDATGHITVQNADTAASPTLTVNGSAAGAATVGLFTSPYTHLANLPGVIVQSVASNGFAILSLAAGGTVVGTSDLSVFQNGTTQDGYVLNRSNASLRLGTNNVDKLVISPTGALAFTTTTAATATLGASGALPAQVLGYISCTVNGTAAKIPYYNT